MSPLSLLFACSGPPPVADGFNRLELEVVDGAEAVNTRFAEAIEAADSEVLAMLPALVDPGITDALVAAAARGLRVEVVTDYDRAEDTGVIALQAAGVPVALADGEYSYYDYNVNDYLTWNSIQAVMSHAMLLLDGVRVLNASEAGGDEAGHRVIFDVTSEDLAYDMALEHNQVFHGTDATALTAYDSLAKSIADSRWRYATQTDLDLEVWLGPQERLTKRVIDAVYGARSSVRILAEDLGDLGLARALQEKAASGVRVEVVVGAGYGNSAPDNVEEFAQLTPDVQKGRTDALLLPTLVLIDVEEADSPILVARAMVLSHPIYSAARIDEGANPVTIGNDQIVDGNLFQLDDYDAPSPELLALRDLWSAYGGR